MWGLAQRTDLPPSSEQEYVAPAALVAKVNVADRARVDRPGVSAAVAQTVYDFYHPSG